MISTCAICQKELSTRAPGVYEKVTGWVSGQGAKGFRTDEHLGRFAHEACLNAKRAGHVTGQRTLAL